MTDIEPVLRVALGLHQGQRGAYALLLGSGISSSAGILTGWGITLDLVSRLVALEGEQLPADLEKWYFEKYQEEPDYDKLLAKLTTTPAERMALLLSYIEPTEEEREENHKQPTHAHHAIAHLVRQGYIRMIVTTNFDKLLETALRDEGVEPDVISSDDMLKGALPYVHSKIYVVKIHGDYKDTRIKNTPSELATYSEEMNALLDRIFDEFGLIICGWSGVWDEALKCAILRSPNRRFTTWWLSQGEPDPKAKDVIEHRRAEQIPIEGADEFFTTLQEKITSLEELGRQHPLTKAAMVATLKRYIPDPTHRLRLHDLFQEEVERVYTFSTQKQTVTTINGKEEHLKLLKVFEVEADTLLAIVTALAYHGEQTQSYLLTQAIERLWIPSGHAYACYPALLFEYAAGIAALAGGRYYHLAALLQAPQRSEDYTSKIEPSVKALNAYTMFRGYDDWFQVSAQRYFAPINRYLLVLLEPILMPYTTSPTQYEDLFCIFEILLAFVYRDRMNANWFIPTLGQAKYLPSNGWKAWNGSYPQQFLERQKALEMGGELVQAGLFGGSFDRFNELYQAFLDPSKR